MKNRGLRKLTLAALSLVVITMLILPISATTPKPVSAFETQSTVPLEWNSHTVLTPCESGLRLLAYHGLAHLAMDPTEVTHQQITEKALPFLKQRILNEINFGHEIMDFMTGLPSIFGTTNNPLDLLLGLTTSCSNQFIPGNHFDDCSFQESTTNIRNRYNFILSSPASTDSNKALNTFGMILHTAQDFYSHSNWVEMQNAGLVVKNSLIDDTLQNWKVLKPYDPLNIPGGRNVIVIEGLTSSFLHPSSLKRDGKLAYVNGQPGLISGEAYVPRGCPALLPPLGHWDPATLPFDPIGLWPYKQIPGVSHLSITNVGAGLNKDTPDRPGYNDAVQLAEKQTTHEWCRLLTLIESSGPDAHTSASNLEHLLETWTNDPIQATRVCHSS